MDVKVRHALIREAFVRLVFVNIMVMLINNINVFVDSIFVGNMFGSQALAAIGFLSPLTAALSLLDILVIGTQILAGKLIGSGDQKKLNTLFFSGFLTLFLLSAACTAVICVFRFKAAGILGATGETRIILSSYMAGYLPCIPFLYLSKYFMALVSFNNDNRLSYISMFAMLACNLLGNRLFGLCFGIIGIGLASTMSNVVSVSILAISFIYSKKAIHMQPQACDTACVLSAMKYGLPYALTILGVTIKNLLTNVVLYKYAGNDGMAAMNIMATLCLIVGAFVVGCYSAYVILAGTYYGEDDRECYIDLAKLALKIGVLICLILSVLIMTSSGFLTGLFVPEEDSAAYMIRRMLQMVPLFSIPNTILYVFLKSYQVQGKSLLVSVFSFLDPFLQGVYAFLLVPVRGTDAAWLSLTVIDVVLVLAWVVIALIRHGKPELSIPILQMLSPDFGAKKGEMLERTVSEVAEVSAISEESIAFCRERGISEQRSLHTGLCIEELAKNVVTYGFRAGKHNRLYIRLVTKNGPILRFRDDCREFNPIKWLREHGNEDPASNIGIRLIEGIAADISHYNNAGINTLQIRL